MNTWQTLLTVLGAIVVAALMIRLVIPHLESRGVDVNGVLSRAGELTDTAGKLLDTVRPFFGDTTTFDRIRSAAHTAVDNAEQLYLIGQLQPGERKDAARQYIRDTLALIGVEITPEVERVIDGAIEAEVLAMNRFYAIDN